MLKASSRSLPVFSALILVIGLIISDSADADNGPSYELRLQFGSSQRWSNEIGDVEEENSAERSLYSATGLGFRMFSPSGHGWLADADYRFDIDIDGFSDEADARIRFAVAHLGYAYRHIIHPRRQPERRAWALTPSLSFSAGSALNRDTTFLSDVPKSSAVLGVRVAFDVDYHIHRFLLGWTLSYEYLSHTGAGNPMKSSHFLGWNFIPIMRMGVTFGEGVQKLQ